VEAWTKKEIRFFKKLSTPVKVQRFLNRIEYDAALGTRSPRWVIREKKANCFEGAIFAAAALRQIGHKPLVCNLRTVNDDDHVIALFKKKGRWGAVAKSNFKLLRFREPVYKSLRELVLSYFDMYYNTLGEKTLRAYSLPFCLAQFDFRNWMTTEEDLSYIGERLDEVKHFRIVTPAMARSLQKMDKDLFKAGLLGAKKAGLYKPKKRK
jgi:hypothetical protein